MVSKRPDFNWNQFCADLQKEAIARVAETRFSEVFEDRDWSHAQKRKVDLLIACALIGKCYDDPRAMKYHAYIALMVACGSTGDEAPIIDVKGGYPVVDLAEFVSWCGSGSRGIHIGPDLLLRVPRRVPIAHGRIKRKAAIEGGRESSRALEFDHDKATASFQEKMGKGSMSPTQCATLVAEQFCDGKKSYKTVIRMLQKRGVWQDATRRRGSQ